MKSAVRFAAVADANDFDGVVAKVAEDDSPIARLKHEAITIYYQKHLLHLLSFSCILIYER